MFKFIIDTDKYSGNFEREMCAYLTGQIGDCGVGAEYRELFFKEESINFDNVINQPDDNGCYRPCYIESTPGWINTGMGNFYRESDDIEEKKILKDYVDSIIEYEQIQIDHYKSIKKKLENGETYSNWTTKSCDVELKRLKAKIEKAKKTKTFYKYPCYNSVAIFFDKKPSAEQIALMKERANKFSAVKRELSKYDFTLSIDGFRLIEVKTVKINHEV